MAKEAARSTWKTPTINTQFHSRGKRLKVSIDMDLREDETEASEQMDDLIRTIIKLQKTLQDKAAE